MKRMTHFILGAVLAVASISAYAQQVFLEGFPDVPLLDGVNEIAEERVVFDTPAGTVAQTVLLGEKGAKEALSRYAANLPTFGWQCSHTQISLTCARDENILLFKTTETAEKSGRIILRLEPTK